MRLLALVSLIAAAAGFAALAVLPWLGRPGPAPAPAPAPVAAAEAPAPPGPPARSDLSPFTERPLFSAARRPPPPEAPGAPVEDPMADYLFNRYQIAGVVKLGDEAVAMLRDMRDGGLLRIRAGDRLDEADVVEITLETLTFRQGAATVVAPVEAEGQGER